MSCNSCDTCNKNVGAMERIGRLVIGLLAIVLGALYIDQPLWMWVSIVFGIIFVGTGLLSFCPLKAIFRKKC